MRFFLSICIPTYNRPQELKRVLGTIDYIGKEPIQIVISDNCSKDRDAVRNVVKEFENKTQYTVKYIEQDINVGYDRNIRSITKQADGKWIMLMSDDDVFVNGSLDKFIHFLKENPDLGYVLRRYRNEYKDGSTEEFRYDAKNVFFEPGVDTYVELFRRSVFLSGFTYKKECFSDYDNAFFDGTLLFQLYIQAMVCLKYKAAYCDVPISCAIEGGIPYFGDGEGEKDKYKTGKNCIDNTIVFLQQVPKIADYIDKKENISSKPLIMRSYSKYSYGYLVGHRQEGTKEFIRYAKRLRELGFADSGYFNLWFIMLLIFGKKGSMKIIQIVKMLVGRTPRL